MQFSIWHWAILLLLIGVPVFFAVRSAIKPSQNPADPVGFGGWLMLLAIGQSLSPLRTLVAIGSSSDGYNQLMLVPNGPMVVYGEIALLQAFLVLQLVVVVAMLRRSPWFKQLFLAQWLAIPVVFILDAALVSTVFGIRVGQVVTGNAIATSIASFAMSGLWVAYVYRSVRVRNTFTRVRASAQVANAS
ncbi:MULTISPECIES: DUF2569 family protein [unclassified Mesorhizobium]|uniref:DUF2569 family protein n=1 Tax=unclassified Mesorhizobium TaxID=325217 RepID=UPI000BAFD917|nr:MULTISPECIES: DUF2569 family protein [unclassified Mesorhizobium]PBB27984.1 hypothetical protein CK232_00235 [Mesorhizobium sp. WSM4304]PBB75485.1 hypothetical protein CK227_12185 [Mesorhizobium sp. WSM4308]